MAEDIKIDTNPLAGLAYTPPTPQTSAVTGYEDMIKSLQTNIETKASLMGNLSDSYKGFLLNNQLANPFDSISDKKIETKQFTVKQEDVYKELSSGELVAMYPDYIPGTDNNERLAQAQSSWEQVQYGLTKAANNLATTVVGNTVGLVIGVGEGIKQGNFNAVFDNSFSRTLDDWNTKLNYQLPNYYTKDEQNENFFESFNNANFWANDVAGGLSFTLGTVVSEGIWAYATGGASLASRAGILGARLGNAGRWGKLLVGGEQALEGVAKYKGFVNSAVTNAFRTGKISKDAAVAFAKTAQGLNTVRFLATTSGNEAGIEAYHFKKEAREEFYDSFERLHGRAPESEDVVDFENDLQNAANGVFATNMAILAPSNMIMFGSLFNIKSPLSSLTKSVNKSLFGIGVEKTAEGAYKGITASTAQKIATVAVPVLKPTITEGLWEEGLQGVTTRAASNWIEAAYAPKYHNQTLSLSDATYKAFAEQYGSKEGWKEIGIGGIIGLFGARGQMRNIRQQREYQDKYVAAGLNTFGDNSPIAADITVKRTMMNARIQNATERAKTAQEAGDAVSAQLAQEDVLKAEIQFRASIGENVTDLIDKYSVALDNLTDEDWKNAGIALDKVDDHKQAVIQGYSELIDSHERASAFADAVMGTNRIIGTNYQNQELKNALVYSIVSGESANKAMDNILKDMSFYIGQENVKVLETRDALRRAGRNVQRKVNNNNKKIAALEQEQTILTEELFKIQNAPKETEGDTTGGTRLADINAKLLRTENELNILKDERQELANQVTQEEKRRKGIGQQTLDFALDVPVITSDDLANIETNLAKIDELIKSYDGLNHAAYYDLIELTNQYKSANQNFINFQASTDAIISGKFKPKFENVQGILGKVFNPKAPIDNFSMEFLEDIYSTYTKSIGQEYASQWTEGTEVSDEEFEVFLATGEVSEEVINSITEKVKNKATLTAKEKQIFDAKTVEINNSIYNPNKPNLTNRAEETAITEEPKTEAEVLRNRIERALNEKYYNVQFIGVGGEELYKSKPSNEDVDRYRELLAKRDNLSQQESEDFRILKQKLSNWRMLDSLVEGEQSIADLIDILNQLETQVDQTETLDNLDANLELEPTEEMKTSTSVYRPDILQNISGNATVQKRDSNGTPTLFFSHIKAKTFVEKLLPTVGIREIQTVKKVKDKTIILNASETLTLANLEKHQEIEGTKFILGETTITVGAGNTIAISEEDFNKVRDELGLSYFDAKAGQWSYQDVYETLPDGTKIKKASEFKVNTISEEIYNVREGDTLSLFLDYRTDWNIGLINDAVQELEAKGEISQELRDKINTTLEITARAARNVSTLKSTKSDTITDDVPLEIRRRYADEFISQIESVGAITGYPNELDLGITVDVKDIYLGTPELVLNEGNIPQEIEFTDRAIEQVIATGYVQGESTTLTNKTLESKVTRQFVTNLAKANPNIKIPVVVFKKGEHFIAYPISMVKTATPQLDKLTLILENNDFSNSEKVKQVNNLLLSLGISPAQYELSQLNQEKIDRISEDLADYTVFRTADELADVKYNKANLKTDAKIKIDLENRAISSPKITVDFSTAVLPTTEKVEDRMIELRQNLTKELLEIQSLINTSVELSDKNKFIEAFDETASIDDGSDIMDRKNVNFLKGLYFQTNSKGVLVNKPVQGDAAKLLTRDRINRIRKQLNQLMFLEEQVKVAKTAQTSPSAAVSTISEKLDRLTETFVKNGKSVSEAESLALESLSEQERDVLRKAYTSELERTEKGLRC